MAPYLCGGRLPGDFFFLSLLLLSAPVFKKNKNKQKHTTFYDLETVTLQSPGRHLELTEERVMTARVCRKLCLGALNSKKSKRNVKGKLIL